MPKNDHISPRSRFKKPSFVTLNVTLTATFRFDIAFFCNPKRNPKRNPNAKNQAFQVTVKFKNLTGVAGYFPLSQLNYIVSLKIALKWHKNTFRQPYKAYNGIL